MLSVSIGCGLIPGCAGGETWKFSLELEPKTTRLVEFGRFALRMAKEKGKKLETIYFLGFTHFCTRNRKGNFMVGRKTEKSRFRWSVQNIQTLMREIRHYSVREQVEKIAQVLRGHYAYYGVGGNFKSLFMIYRYAERATLPGKDSTP
jgi:RNA-directed DNA polymerase